MIRLGVNIDHVATVRQARHENFPDPLRLAQDAIRAGADGITAHLREDRRHIQDADIVRLKKNISAPLNMEMSIAAPIVKIALAVKPAWTCLVPEKREELTTEGGLNIKAQTKKVAAVIKRLHTAKIRVSLFLDPDPDMIALACDVGADAVELHTGVYARVWDDEKKCGQELKKIKTSAVLADRLGLIVNAGHGLNYANVRKLALLFPFYEFNIGFAIVARALTIGMTHAVDEMKEKMKI